MSDTAKTILAQLGGTRFVVMTGAKHIFSDNGGKALVFQLPRGARDGINAVRVELDASDTYTVTFTKIARRTYAVTKVREVSFVYADQLRTLFTATTGLETSL
jgi:hypothetical protein